MKWKSFGGSCTGKQSTAQRFPEELDKKGILVSGGITGNMRHYNRSREWHFGTAHISFSGRNHYITYIFPQSTNSYFLVCLWTLLSPLHGQNTLRNRHFRTILFLLKLPELAGLFEILLSFSSPGCPVSWTSVDLIWKSKLGFQGDLIVPLLKLLLNKKCFQFKLPIWRVWVKY